MGEKGVLLGQAITRAGEAAGATITHFAKLNSQLGFAAGIAAGLAVFTAELEVSFLGMAVAAARAAAETFKLSQSSGVSMQALTGLTFAAKEVGLDMESLNRGLLRLNRTAFDAATAPAGSINAYTRLGIALRDAQGNLRPTEQLLFDVADRFEQLPNGVSKSALAIQIFGRNGAVMIPVLNLGRDGLREFYTEAQKLGVVLDTNAGAAAREFEKNLVRLQQAAVGVGNQIMLAVLPQLQRMTDSLVRFVEDSSKSGGELGHVVSDVLARVLTLGAAIGSTFAELKDLLDLIIFEVGAMLVLVGAVTADVAKLDFSSAKKDISFAFGEMKKLMDDFVEHSKKRWTDLKTFANDIAFGLPKVTPLGKARDTVDTAQKENEALAALRKKLAALKEEESDSIRVASAVGTSAAAIADETAIKKASKEITELLNSAVDKEGNKLEGVRRAILAQRKAFEDLNLVISVNNELTKLGTTLHAEVENLKFETRAIADLARAYQLGGEAVHRARIDEATAKDAARLKELGDRIANLAIRFGAFNPIVVQARLELQAAQKELDDKRALLLTKAFGLLSTEVSNATAQFKAEADAVQSVNAAQLQSAEAVSIMKAIAEAEKEIHDKNIVNIDDQNAIQQLYLDRAERARASSAAEAAGALSITRGLRDIRDHLIRIKTESEGAFDVIVRATAEATKRQEELLHALGEDLLKVGNLRGAFSGFLLLMRERVANPIEDLFKNLLGLFDRLEDTLADFAVKGKANFKEVFQEFEKQLVKTGFRDLFGHISGGILGKLGIGGGKVGESPSKPMYVRDVDKFAGLLGKTGGEKEGVSFNFEGLKGFFSGIGGFFSKIFSGIGGFFSKIFGGFLATGGDVTPGRAYIVGEKHPEFFVPTKPGKVVPSLELTGQNSTQVEVHFHGITDIDSFRRNQTQIAAHFYDQAARAYQRNR